MSTNPSINHMEVADEIYEYLRYEYKFLTHKGMTVDKCKLTLAKKLKRLTSLEILCWSNALDEIAKLESDNAPTPNEIIKAIVYQAKKLRPIAEKQNPKIEEKQDLDYVFLWNSADDRGKYRFFIDHKFSDVPPFIRYWFTKYNKKHRGWTPQESNKMIRFWKSPFMGAHEGAMITYQNEIIKYFEER